jgi:hypothetical protein
MLTIILSFLSLIHHSPHRPGSTVGRWMQKRVADWLEIRTNTMLVVTPKMNLLQIPIIDEFHVPPQCANTRGVDFAATKGLLSPNPKTPMTARPRSAVEGEGSSKCC